MTFPIIYSWLLSLIFAVFITHEFMIERHDRQLRIQKETIHKEYLEHLEAVRIAKIQCENILAQQD